MAQGAIARSGADVAVAISGVAGPSGGTERNPVGSVWIAVTRRQGGDSETSAVHRVFAGDRDAVRRQAAEAALADLLQCLQSRDDG
jgi:nicotinamide-nucleotide amidase